MRAGALAFADERDKRGHLGTSGSYGSSIERNAAFRYAAERMIHVYAIPDGYLTSIEAAERLGVSEHALRHKRSRGTGLPYYRIDRRVLYKETDIEQALNPKPIRAH